MQLSFDPKRTSDCATLIYIKPDFFLHHMSCHFLWKKTAVVINAVRISYERIFQTFPFIETSFYLGNEFSFRLLFLYIFFMLTHVDVVRDIRKHAWHGVDGVKYFISVEIFRNKLKKITSEIKSMMFFYNYYVILQRLNKMGVVLWKAWTVWLGLVESMFRSCKHQNSKVKKR